MKRQAEDLFGLGEAAVGIISLVGLYAVSRFSYPAFHTIAELFSIIIGFSLFMLIWNSRRIIDNHYLIFIGIAYLFVASFDLIHTLAYKQINLFIGYGTNLPTQLWIAARYVESLSLVAAPFFIRRDLRTGWTFVGYTALSMSLLASIFSGLFPDCYVDGVGLTRFKVLSEYLISAILLCSLILLLRKRKEFDRDVLHLLVLSIVVTMGSELSFTFYVDFYDIPNLIGHYLKIISFYLIYKAIIDIGLSKPYNLMFRNLQQHEAALVESEERYRALFNGMTEGFAIHEIITDEHNTPVDYRFLDINPAFEHLTGLKREDVVGKTHNEVLPANDPMWLRTYGAVALTGEPVQFENYVPTLKRHYEVLAYCPAPRQFAVIFMDITARKLAEAKLHRYELLAKHHRDIILFIELDGGRILEANDAAAKGYGYRYEELLTLTIHNLRAADMPRLTTDQLAMAYEHGLIFETVHRRQDGSIFPVEVSAHGAQIDGRRILISAVRDITQRKQVERALNEKTEALEVRTQQMEAANKDLESFSYSVSHDLRAPLRAIDGYSRMILKKAGEQFDEETQRRFQVIRDNAEAMGQLIDDLLAFSRLGRQEVTKRSLNMEELIRDAWQELIMINPDRAMTLKMEPMPAAFGDHALIRQVYGNLLGNAVKFTQRRNPAVIEAGCALQKNEKVYYIRDNGIGFNMNYYDKLFGVFQRLHSEEEYKGTGIGLALVQRIIQRHGGRIWAEGEVDKGATFSFTLPIRQE